MQPGFVTVDGVRLSCGESPDNGPTLVFLTGFPDTWEDYRPLLDALETDYHVSTMTYRGLGQSEHAAPYRIADWVSETAAFIRDVAGAPALGIGHSAGAWFGLAAAVSEPDLFRAFVSLDQPLDPAVHVEFHKSRIRFYGAYAKAMRAASGREDLVRRLAEVPTPGGQTLGEIESEEELLEEADFGLCTDPEVFAAWEHDSLAELLMVPELESLPGAYTGPLLFVYGDPDAGSLVSREARRYNQERYPWAENVEIAGANHSLGLYDDPARVVKEIRRFLGSLDE